MHFRMPYHIKEFVNTSHVFILTLYMSEQELICKLLHTASSSFKPKMLNNLANNLFSDASSLLRKLTFLFNTCNLRGKVLVKYMQFIIVILSKVLKVLRKARNSALSSRRKAVEFRSRASKEYYKTGTQQDFSNEIITVSFDWKFFP